MINPFRAAGYIVDLALDCVEAAMCSLSCDRTVHAMWEEAKRKARAEAVDALAEKEAEEEVAEPSAFDHYAAHVPEPVFKYGGTRPISEEDMARENALVDEALSAPVPRWAQKWASGKVRPDNHPTLPNASAPGCPPTPVAESPQEVSAAPNPGVETPAGTPTADDFFAAAFFLRSYADRTPLVSGKCHELAGILYAAGQTQLQK